MVTAAVPVEVNVKICVVGVFTATLPNDIVVELKPNVGTDDPSCTANVSVTIPSVAETVAVCDEVTVATVAAKLALVAPAATVAAAGTVTAVLLLARFTAKPPVAAAVFKVTVQVSVPAPVIDPLEQTSPLSFGVAAPFNLIASFFPEAALLDTVIWPLVAPATVGLNPTVNVAVCPGIKVIGKLAPEIENPVPVIERESTVSGAVPVEEIVTACVVVVPTGTDPKVTVVVLAASAGETAPS